MPMTCSVCSHPERNAIDAALTAPGESKRGIARRFALGDDAVRRHTANHLTPELRRRVDLAEASRLDGYIAGLEGLERQAERRGKAAEEKGDIRTALAAQHEQRETLLSKAKLLGVGARETIDLQVSEVHHFEPPPEFLARVVQNLADLKLPDPDRPMLLDVAKTPEVTEGDDLVEVVAESDIDEYDAASGEVRPHRNGATPPPTGLGVLKLPGHDGRRDRWDWG